MSVDEGIIERQFYVPVEDDGLFVKLVLHTTPETDEIRPTLVFLHEGLGSVGQWKSFPYELCKATGCDGLVYDRVGHGRSTALQNERDVLFYAAEAEQYLHGLLAELNVRKPILFGHSDGGMIALKYASSFPESTVGVVAEAAHVLIEDVTIEGIRDASRQYAETDLPARLSRFHGEKTDAMFHAWSDTWLGPVAADWDMLDDLSAIRCPILIVQGDQDQFGSRKQVDAIENHAGGETEVLWLRGIGHVPHLQSRARVITETCRWVEALIQKNAG